MISADFRGDKATCSTIVTAIKSNEKVWPVGEEVEQKIYEGFPSKEDETLMSVFRNAKWQDRTRIVQQFGDPKYRQLALRLIYLEKQDALTNEESSEIKKTIHKRFHPATNKEHPWRSLDDALKELSEPRAMELGNTEQIAEIGNWLYRLGVSIEGGDLR